MQLKENISLKQFNTFGIDVSAKYFCEINSVDEYRELLDSKTISAEKKLILGGGSNILFTKNFDGLVIRNNIRGIEIVSETETHVIIKAAAGESWHNLVLWCVANNYGGIENLSLIPGLAGAAPMQNIGAYGVEIKDVFHQLEAIDAHTGELTMFDLNDCHFGYRESVFKHKYKDQFLISSLSLRLTKVSSKTIYHYKTEYGDVKATLSEMRAYDLSLKAVSDAIIKIRSSKLPDPKVIGNAGSFFKNPVISKQQFETLVMKYPVMPSYLQKDGTVKVPAGWLIEQCGWKGKVVGNTGAHATQALVLVNYGNATGKEIWNLAMEIQQSVKEKFGIDITPEVNVV
ncbi:MAG: UDP-N-acetylenolpyruvoylglucosamine reductase [Bacteroidota bacterium]|nr:UDP-N-acetylenolpyruvoylglucosamine reductase [Bacteroidota bacterium]